MATVDHDTLARWLGVYAGAPGHVSLTAFRDGRHQSHHYGTDADGLAAAMVEAQRLSDSGHDVYMRTTTVDVDQLGPGERGGAEQTAAVIGIGTDLDHGQGHHKRTDLPPTPGDALSLIEGMPPPTIVVNSGGGFYAWWLFDAPSTDLEMCAPLLKRWNSHIIARAADHGWHVDQVGDLPRILRPVGTVSYKGGGEPAQVVVHEHTGLRYDPAQLQEWLDDNAPEPVVTHQPAPSPAHLDSNDLPGRIKRRLSCRAELELRGVHVPPSGMIRCPFPSHDDHTPSFHVYEEDGWACFGSSCQSGGGGSVIDLVMCLDGVGIAEAIRYCAARIGEPQPDLAGPNLVAAPEALRQAADVAQAHTDAAAVLPLDPGALDPTDPMHAAVLNEYVRIVARRHAASMDVAATAVVTPGFMRLDEMLARPLPAVTYRIVGLWPNHGRVLLAAQFKSGKSTMVANVIRSLVDGVPFLGQHPVQPLDEGRTVALIDDELHDQTLQRWYADQNIRNDQRVAVTALRGKTSTFNILDPHVRQEWADRIAATGAQVIIFDCLRPILDALGLSEDKDAGRFLVAFDELCDAAGVTEAIVVHHMGHDGERSRGDSRLRDWPDVEWKVVRDGEAGEDDPSATRYFMAYGRDVDEPERRLDFNPATRMLTLSGGDRRSEREIGDALTVAAHLQEAAMPLSFNQLKLSLGCGVGKAQRLVKLAVKHGFVAVDKSTGVDIHTLTPKGETA